MLGTKSARAPQTLHKVYIHSSRICHPRPGQSLPQLPKGGLYPPNIKLHIQMLPRGARSRHICLAFDAFDTLFTPRRPVFVQYGEIARAYGISGFSDNELQASFKQGEFLARHGLSILVCSWGCMNLGFYFLTWVA